METLIHADIFFFIATIWAIIISAIFVVILWNVSGIVSDLRHISRKIREGGDVLSEDLGELRDNIRTEGGALKHTFGFFKHLFSKRQSRKK